MINDLIAKLETNLKEAIKTGAQINSKAKIIFDFQKNKQANIGGTIMADIKLLQKRLLDTDNEKAESLAQQLIKSAAAEDKKQILATLEEIKKLPAETKDELTISMPRLPAELKTEIETDLIEIKKCYSAGCHRSAIVLCGRILEAALHRKYYETTGQDILEKNPGIGLGSLIAKLNEKGVEFDPGLAQQIHLVNQVRIFSVHKKQRTFMPTKAQTNAIILFTTDTLEKLF